MSKFSVIFAILTSIYIETPMQSQYSPLILTISTPFWSSHGHIAIATLLAIGKT
jgi:hypothetical protein